MLDKLHRRPRDAHLARGAGAGRRLRSRDAPHRRRRQRRATTSPRSAASATLIAVTGQDDAAATLAEACREAGIAPSLVGDATRPTTTKVRIVTERNQQVARIDYEVDAEIAGDDRGTGSSPQIQKHAALAAAIVVSDYLKGCVSTEGDADGGGRGGRAAHPVLVDPKIPHIDYYAGATLVTPNHHEAETGGPTCGCAARTTRATRRAASASAPAAAPC